MKTKIGLLGLFNRSEIVNCLDDNNISACAGTPIGEVFIAGALVVF